MTETDNQRVSVCNPAPFVAQEYATAHGPAWCAIDPGSGIVVATTTQEAASHAADAMNAAYRLGAQRRWCETVPVEYADAASELMAAAEDASCGFDALEDDHLEKVQRAVWVLRGDTPCEGCGNASTGHDPEGVPLCDDCGGERSEPEALNADIDVEEFDA